MTDEQYLDWEKLFEFHSQLYERLQHPITRAIEQVYQSPRLTIQQLQLVYNRLQAWSEWLKWKAQPESFGEEAFEQMHLGEAPTWFFETLNRSVSIKMEHSKTIYIHPSTFYEALLLLLKLTYAIGKLSHITTNDANPPQNGIWLRIVFTPSLEKKYSNLSAVIDTLEQNVGKNVHFEVDLIRDLLLINHTRYVLQTNTRTGHQAFAILIPSNATAAHEIQGDIPLQKQTTQPQPSAVPTNTIPEKLPTEIPTIPMPATTLHEKADEIDRNNNVLTQIQDILLDYVTTPTLASRPDDILHDIYQLLQQFDSMNPPETPSDRIKLTQVYDVLDTSPLKLKKALPAITAEMAKTRLAALQVLLLEPFLPIKREPSLNGTVSLNK
ncbi:MAG: hypothetical protein CUN55_03305 [Phototrophicales bacterium]|nr:MAG: hypothetical protein CUN55_03305 [Phototrophicales bacterium]